MTSLSQLAGSMSTGLRVLSMDPEFAHRSGTHRRKPQSAGEGFLTGLEEGAHRGSLQVVFFTPLRRLRR